MEDATPRTDECVLGGGGRTRVVRRGDVVHRVGGPWSATVLDLLRYLNAEGFHGAPAVIEPGMDEAGRETLTFIDGVTAHPGPWSRDTLASIGALMRQLHDLTRRYRPGADAFWQPWFGRHLGHGARVIGHCDAAPWNILRTADQVTLIDWETAGPVNPLVELAQVCWLNAQLHDDDVAQLQGLGSPTERAADVRAIVDGYELDAPQRHSLPEFMIEVACQDAADQARSAGITQATTDTSHLWAIAWRARAAAWMLTHRRTLSRALD
jgi:hypothetical protein